MSHITALQIGSGVREIPRGQFGTPFSMRGFFPVDPAGSGFILVPPGVDLDANIQAARNWTMNPISLLFPLAFYDLVRTRGLMDYKQMWPKGLYAPFGNLSYGAVGRAYGYPAFLLRRAAGWYQEFRSHRAYSPAYGHFYTGFPYGDDANDQFMIDLGFQYYDSQ